VIPQKKSGGWWLRGVFATKTTMTPPTTTHGRRSPFVNCTEPLGKGTELKL